MEKDLLWAHMFKSRYYASSKFIFSEKRNKDSIGWKEVWGMKELIRYNSRYLVGNGKKHLVVQGQMGRHRGDPEKSRAEG